MPGFLEDIGKGAAGGAAAGPWGAAIGAGAAVIPSVFKFFSGMSQKRQANRINPTDPGFVANTSLIDNARQLEERYRNYTMPGYSDAVNNVNATAATAFDNGVQGASSGGDVLDLATRINYGTGQNLNQLATQNAQGADAALNNYLQANSMAGNEAVRKNIFELDRYDQQLREKAALSQAGSQNMFGAGDDVANAVRQFTQQQTQVRQPGNKTGITPQKRIF